ncbi:flavodoxin domain-containing protein [Bacillus sp. JJ1562]|uniref:flavodoxin domain-containing protein n=1 Tax=Bacillus sp. JJ1562 TaxID=3122960 RepID=UPI003001C6E2
MKVAIVYTSITGNTEEAVKIVHDYLSKCTSECYVYQVEYFPFYKMESFDAIIIGTYTWGNGNIPHEMIQLYRAFENSSTKDIVTGVLGTGDQCYPHFCGAVDEFRDMLFVHSNLAATLKVELMPQRIDEHRFERFVEVVMERVNSLQGITV